MNLTSPIPISIRTGVYGVTILDSKILVVQQKQGVHEGKFDLPGGGIEPGETIEEALRREFQEEVGMSFDLMTHLCNLTAITENREKSTHLHQIGLIYKIENICKMEHQNPELDSFWIEVEECAKMNLTPFLQKALKNLKTINEL
jgi:ADP-ribose pyrophosphatase YjhB (NUDIX family)